jgi:WD40 repeat protein
VAGLLTTVAVLLLAGSAGSGLAAANFQKIANQEKKARGDAVEAQRDANRRAEENRRRLVREYVANGTKRMDEGDPLAALPWLVEALKLDAGDRAREEPHRLRLATVLSQCPRLVRFVLAEGYIHNIYFGRNGRRALTSDRGGVARLWDVDTAATIGPPMAVGERCIGSFSADGRFVATLTDSGIARVWDADTGLALAPSWVVPLGRGSHAAWPSPNGRRLLTAEMINLDKADKPTTGSMYRLWDTTTGQPIGDSWTLNASWISPPALFRADGLRVTIFCNNLPADCRDTETGLAVASALATDGGVLTNVLKSPDGLLVAVHRQDGSFRVWDVEGDKAVSPLITPSDTTWIFTFSGDGRRLATLTTPKTGSFVTVWEIATGQPVGAPILPPRGFSAAPWSLSLDHDGGRVALAQQDHVSIWDTVTGRLACAPLRHDHAVKSATFSPDGRFLLTIDQGETERTFDTATGQLVGSPMRHNAQIEGTPSFSPDGRRTRTVCYDQTAWVREITPPGPPFVPLPNSVHVSASSPNPASFSPDGREVVTSSIDKDGTVPILSAETGLAVGPPLTHGEPVRQTIYSPDGRLIATISEREVRIWDTKTRQLVRPPTRLEAKSKSAALGSAAFTRDARRFVVRFVDTLTLLEVAGGPPVTLASEGRELNPFRFAHQEVGFRDDGRRVMAVGIRGELGVWDTANGQAVGPVRGPFYPPLISPNGRLVFSGGSEGKGRFWDIETGRAVPPLIEQASPVIRPLAFSPDGRLLLTASQEPTVRVWDTTTGQPALPALLVAGPNARAVFSADGSRILTWSLSDRKPHVRVWETRTGEPLTPSVSDERFSRLALFSPDGGSVLAIDVRDRRAWLWRLLPDDRPVADLARFSTLLTGRRVHETFGLVPVEPEAIQRAWDATKEER